VLYIFFIATTLNDSSDPCCPALAVTVFVLSLTSFRKVLSYSFLDVSHSRDYCCHCITAANVKVLTFT